MRFVNSIGSEPLWKYTSLASFVAISEISAGLALIVGGFIKNPYGNGTSSKKIVKIPGACDVGTGLCASFQNTWASIQAGEKQEGFQSPLNRLIWQIYAD